VPSLSTSLIQPEHRIARVDQRERATPEWNAECRLGRSAAGIGATARVATAAAVVAIVNAGTTAVARILQEAAVLVAFRFTAAVLDLAPTTSRKLAGLGIDHAAARGAASPAIGQAAM
jgi:hypothetical protein